MSLAFRKKYVSPTVSRSASALTLARIGHHREPRDVRLERSRAGRLDPPRRRRWEELSLSSSNRRPSRSPTARRKRLIRLAAGEETCRDNLVLRSRATRRPGMIREARSTTSTRRRAHRPRRRRRSTSARSSGVEACPTPASDTTPDTASTASAARVRREWTSTKRVGAEGGAPRNRSRPTPARRPWRTTAAPSTNGATPALGVTGSGRSVSMTCASGTRRASAGADEQHGVTRIHAQREPPEGGPTLIGDRKVGSQASKRRTTVA